MTGIPYGPWGAGEQAIKMEFFWQWRRLLHAATGTLAGVGQNMGKPQRVGAGADERGLGARGGPGPRYQLRRGDTV